MFFSEARKIIAAEIEKDSSIKLTYISNMVYAFENEYKRYCKEHKKRHLKKADVHAIATKAAAHFLDIWLL